MDYNTYKKNLSLIFLLYFLIIILMLLLNRDVVPSANVAKAPFVSIVLYYASRILSLYLLFFSIYAYISGVKETRKLEKPSIFIIAGTLLVAALFAPPILGHFMVSEMKTEVFVKVDSSETRKEAMNKNSTSKRRLEIAENHYLATGESISYLNNDDREVIYTPDDKRSKLTNELKSSIHQLDLAKNNLGMTALSLILLIIISGVIFIFFLWYKFKAGTLRRGGS